MGGERHGWEVVRIKGGHLCESAVMIVQGGDPRRESGIISFTSWDPFTAQGHQILEPGKRFQSC